MYHPTRGGVRGGKDQFSWEQVKTDKDRECYLGHSLMAPVGRWQEGKDLIWYSKENTQNEITKKNDEFLKAKELEEQALMSALGYKVVKKEQHADDKTNESKKQAKPKISKSSTNLPYKVPKYEVRRPTKLIELDNKKALDSFLKKLIKKYGLKALTEALGGDEHESKKKKKKKKSK